MLEQLLQETAMTPVAHASNSVRLHPTASTSGAAAAVTTFNAPTASLAIISVRKV